MKVRGLFLMFFVFLAVVSCKLNDDELQVITDVEDTFSINLLEELTTTPRSFVLQLKSLQRQECGNYLINHNLNKQEDGQFTLAIEGLILPGNVECNNEAAFIAKDINIGTLPMGIHEVQINLRDAIVNEGLISVTEKGYELILESHIGIEFLNWELMRIPEQSIWGYVGFHDRPSSDENPENTTLFIEGLNAYANKIEPETGYYGKFISDDSNELTLLEDVEVIVHKPFLFSHFDNLSEIKQYAERFREDVDNPNFEIKIFTSEGFVLIE